MLLKNLKLNNFKNYSEIQFEFNPKINCFVGNNGSGKTNALDAIYYLSFCKSYFNNIDSQNIKHHEDYFIIHGAYLKKGKTDKISCGVKKNQKKSFKLNKVEYDRLADHIGLYPLVIIAPDDHELIKGGSEVRRKYMDGVIAQFDRIYLDNLIKYQKLVSQRNALLKRFKDERFFDKAMLDILSEQLSPLCENILEKRIFFLKGFNKIFQKYHTYISGTNEQVNIHHNTSIVTDKNFATQLQEVEQKDRMLTYTSIGTHKDDLDFEINSVPLKKFGSQGQQKTFIIALKIAQFFYIKNIKKISPLILLDDIFDKLDETRIKKLLILLNNESFGQIFITDTNRERTHKLLSEVGVSHKIFQINAGNITDEKDE